MMGNARASKRGTSNREFTLFSYPYVSKMVNIGQRIHDVVLHKQCNITRLAAELGCDRKTLYRLFDKTSIDTQLLLRISIVLQYDFFEEYRLVVSEQIDSQCDCGIPATANKP